MPTTPCATQWPPPRTVRSIGLRTRIGTPTATERTVASTTSLPAPGASRPKCGTTSKVSVSLRVTTGTALDVMTYHPKSLEVDTPLARTYNGYSNIVFANLEGIQLDRRRPLSDFDYYDTFLKWSTAYVFQKTFRVSANCISSCESVESNHCTIARTVNGRFRNDFIDLYQTFFYEIDSVWRASTIVHEVRHAHDGVQHDGGTACPGKSACDRSWSSGGANTYEALWLAAFYYAPEKHPFISDMRRARAKSLFFETVRNGFLTPALWSLNQLKDINEIPEFYVERAVCSEDPQQPHHCIGLASR